MNVTFDIELNEIEKVPAGSFRGNTCWKVKKKNIFGITYIIEQDGTDGENTYLFGNLEDGCFNELFYGYGEPTDTDNIGVGNAFTTVRICGGYY